MRRVILAVSVILSVALLPAGARAIVGGTDAPAGTYPSLAKVTINGLFGCTGTLIAPRWVLTAGHCSSLTGAVGVAIPVSFPPQSYRVTVGGVKADGSDGEPVTVDQAKIPTGYLAVDGYDVTLLHLAAPATAHPTPVAGRGYEPLWKPNVLEEIVGFGTTAEGGAAPPQAKRAEVPIVPDAACGAAYSGFEPTTQICAGYAAGEVDSCQGDSGGPLYGRTGAGVRLLVGATSYGVGCARAGQPGVYARVADAPLRDGFIRVNAPEAIADAPAGAVTAPLRVYDPSTGTSSPGAPGAASPEPSPAPPGTSSPPPPATTATGPGSQAGAGTTETGAASTQTSGSGQPKLPAATPTSATATSGSADGFRVALAVDARTLLRTARARGVRARVRCSSACKVTLRLRVDGATARRFRLRSRTVGSLTFRRATGGRTVRRVRFSRALRNRVGRDRRTVLSIVATVTERGSGRNSVLNARARTTGS